MEAHSNDTITLHLSDGLEAMTDMIIFRTLDMCSGNITAAARVLGISRKTIYTRMAKPGRSNRATCVTARSALQPTTPSI
jgi:transcriptional regulator of acetoin/glycerol metabolism